MKHLSTLDVLFHCLKLMNRPIFYFDLLSVDNTLK